MSISKFSLISLAASGLFCLAVFFIGPFLYPEGALPFAITGICLAAMSTIVSFAIVARGLKIRIQQFMTYIMGGMMMKMFIGIVSIMLVALKFEKMSAPYVLTYFFCYFIFTAFEVITLMSNLRAQKSDEKADKNENGA